MLREGTIVRDVQHRYARAPEEYVSFVARRRSPEVAREHTEEREVDHVAAVALALRESLCLSCVVRMSCRAVRLRAVLEAE